VGFRIVMGWVVCRDPATTGAQRSKQQSKRAIKSGRLAVFYATPQNIDQLPVEDVWGVGQRYAARLTNEGVHTAADLAALPTDAVRDRYGVTLARTQTELRGIACGDLELEEPDRQQLVVSRMFGRDVLDPMDALVTFATVACAKLRERNLAAGALWVWLDGNPHKGNGFHVSRASPLPFPTRDTAEVLRAVRFLAKSIMRPGQHYKRGGVGLTSLVRCEQRQSDLFFEPCERQERGMEVLDRINAKFGRGTVGLGAAGWRVGGARPGEARRGSKDAQWRPILRSLSPSYTTKWDQLLRVR